MGEGGSLVLSLGQGEGQQGWLKNLYWALSLAGHLFLRVGAQKPAGAPCPWGREAGLGHRPSLGMLTTAPTRPAAAGPSPSALYGSPGHALQLQCARRSLQPCCPFEPRVSLALGDQVP